MDDATYAEVKTRLQQQLARSNARQPANDHGLPPLPFKRYSDPELHALETRHLWTKTWLLAGHAAELPDIGSYKLWQNLDVPILLLRDDESRIRAFYNLCRHRGGSLVAADRGTVTRLSCLFHGWSYDLKGQLRGVPQAHEFPLLRKQEKSLLELRCECYGNLIFVNRDPSAPTLTEYLGDAIGRDWQDYDFERRVVYHSDRYDVPVNWKYVYEAFVEAYHTRPVHNGSFADSVAIGGVLCDPFDGGHWRMVTAMRSDSELRDKNPMHKVSVADPRHRLAAEAFVSYGVFPNIAGAFSDGDFALFSIWPVTIERTAVDIYYLARQESGRIDEARSAAFRAAFPVIMDEDMNHLSRAAAGIRSGLLDTLTLGGAEPLVQHFNETVDQTIGVDRIPPALRTTRVNPRRCRASEIP